jgi:hypothetical protein
MPDVLHRAARTLTVPGLDVFHVGRGTQLIVRRS